MKGWNICGEEIHRREKGEGKNIGREDMLVEGWGGDIHGKESVWNGNYTEKGRRTHIERGPTRKGDIHGEGTYTERVHTPRGYTHGEGTHREGIHGEGTYTER